MTAVSGSGNLGPHTAYEGHRLEESDLEEGFEFVDVGSSNQSDSVGQKLSFEEICKRMKPLICKILGEGIEKTGFFLNERGLIVTAFSAGKAKSIMYQGETYHIQGASIEGYSQEKAQRLGLQFFQIKTSGKKLVLESLGLLRLPTKEDGVNEGAKVYFAGFSSEDSVPHFGKRYISSLSPKKEQEALSFTVDGTLDAASAGAPVVMQNQGSLLLVGIIGVNKGHEISEMRATLQKIQPAKDPTALAKTISSLVERALMQKETRVVGAVELWNIFSPSRVQSNEGRSLKDLLSGNCDKEGTGEGRRVSGT